MPGRDVRGVGRGCLVAEEIHVVGALGQPLDGAQFGFQRRSIEHARRNRAQAAGFADRGGQQVILGARHGRLDDGKLGAKKIAQVHGQLRSVIGEASL